MEIPYYPGCTLKTTAKNFDDSAFAVYKKLGIELKELPRWNCCGTVYSLTSDDLMHHLAPIRNLIRVEEQGADQVVTLCSMCYNTLAQSNLRIQQNEEERDKLNEFMYKEKVKYDGKVKVLHGLTVLRDMVGYDKIKSQIKKPLDGLKVAAYYGCLLLRPKEVCIDDPESPTIMEDLIRTTGAEAVPFPYANECCCSYETVSNKDIVIERTRMITQSAQAYGADVIITSCPLCEFNLDNRQKEVRKKYPDHVDIPVLYYTQLLGKALGLPLKSLRFDLNYINPRELFK
ncbi:CoB--CoM heterodisulfide reductase iron-sulfur subunit B family protein [bacterium]|nr:CoB--CoM heterodisulfide reductase iron-sulfur subunit B family protein [bacterium]